MNLTPHFTLQELTVTSKTLDNTPSDKILDILKTTASNMEKVKDILNGAIINVSSGYRSVGVNKAVGGASTSAHLLGYAVDFTAKGYTPLQIALSIAHSDLKFDQLIYEGTWVHISFDPKQRMDILTAIFTDGKTKYVKGL